MTIDPQVALIIPASGFSRRFGADDKLLAQVEGRPLISHVVDAAVGSRAKPVLVVLRPDQQKVREHVARARVECVENDRAAEGLSTSIIAGLRHVPDICAGVAILPADMPYMTADVIDILLQDFCKFDTQKIVVPKTLEGDQRNPVVWPRDLFAELMQLTGDVGGKALLGRYAGRIVGVPVDDDRVFADVDTQRDRDTFARPKGN